MVALWGLDQAQWRINRLYIGASGDRVGASGRYMAECRQGNIRASGD